MFGRKQAIAILGISALIISGCGASSESALISNPGSNGSLGGQYISEQNREENLAVSNEPQDVIPEAYYSDDERIAKLAAAMYNGTEFEGSETGGSFRTPSASNSTPSGTSSTAGGSTSTPSPSPTSAGTATPTTTGTVTPTPTPSGTVTPTPTPKPTPSGNSKPNTDIAPMEVIFYDIGQGDCTLVKCDGHSLLIDCGETSKGSEVRLKLLQKQNVENLDFLMLTHPDSDHIGGAASVIDNVKIDAIWMSDFVKTNDVYTRLMDTIRRKDVYYYTPKVGNEYYLGDAVIKVIAPNNTYDNPNDSSVGIIIEHGKNRFLFAGDATTNAEADIIKNGLDISADVYKVNHHGSASSTSQAFLDAVNPTYAVISCGKNNDYGHPTKEVLDKLKAKNVSVFRTDEQGTVTVTSDGSNLTWSTEPSTTWAAGTGTGKTYGEQAHAGATATPTPMPTPTPSPTPTSTPFIVNDVGDTGNMDRSLPNTSGSSTVKRDLPEPEPGPGAVWIPTDGGKKYHKTPDCSGMTNPIQVSVHTAQEYGFTACKKCYD